MNLKKNSAAVVDLVVIQNHVTVKDRWTRRPSTLLEVLWVHSLLQTLTPVLTREARFPSKVSPGLSAERKSQLSLYSRLTDVTNDMTYNVTTSEATLLDLCEDRKVKDIRSLLKLN